MQQDDSPGLERGDFIRAFKQEGGKTYEATGQEMDPFLHRAKVFREARERHGGGKESRHGAHMPLNVYWEVCRNVGVGNPFNLSEEEKRRVKTEILTNYRKFVVDPGAWQVTRG